MILADKIILERKKNGWSQEELADKLGVTRQAVSKWEGAQTTPDLLRLLEMSKLFGVTVDYLIKDEMEAVECVPADAGEDSLTHRVSMDEANEFLRVKKKTAPQVAFAVMLCILSPIGLVLLAVCAEQKLVPLSENAACGLGMIILLAFVAAACAVFISCGLKTKPYCFLDKEIIETEYGVTGMVAEKERQYKEVYARCNILGTVICICGVMLLFSGIIISEGDLAAVISFCLMLVVESVGVCFFIVAGITQASFEKLLQEGDYTVKNKTKTPLGTVVGTVYWLVATAVFLAVGFMYNNWRDSVFVWPIAAVLFPAVLLITKMFEKK
ncbi:MAG: helix-turn-helix domain-containing protein [Lachnospiraceae bacterium]|nr:helix-turn-helix domain-containing protein [Lachnospiraceae bacterium]